MNIMLLQLLIVFPAKRLGQCFGVCCPNVARLQGSKEVLDGLQNLELSWIDVPFLLVFPLCGFIERQSEDAFSELRRQVQGLDQRVEITSCSSIG